MPLELVGTEYALPLSLTRELCLGGSLGRTIVSGGLSGCKTLWYAFFSSCAVAAGFTPSRSYKEVSTTTVDVSFTGNETWEANTCSGETW